LDHFVTDEWRRATAKKRNGVAGESARNQLRLQRAATAEPSAAFEVAWARQVLNQSLSAMEAECRSSGRLDVWGVFECRILTPVLEGSPPLGYDELVKRFGFRSPSQASNALITAKRMFERNLRATLGEYARSPTETEEEIREIRRILSRAGAGSG
jgi:hypothetical protein